MCVCRVHVGMVQGAKFGTKQNWIWDALLFLNCMVWVFSPLVGMKRIMQLPSQACCVVRKVALIYLEQCLTQNTRHYDNITAFPFSISVGMEVRKHPDDMLYNHKIWPSSGWLSQHQAKQIVLEKNRLGTLWSYYLSEVVVQTLQNNTGGNVSYEQPLSLSHWPQVLSTGNTEIQLRNCTII